MLLLSLVEFLLKAVRPPSRLDIFFSAIEPGRGSLHFLAWILLAGTSEDGASGAQEPYRSSSLRVSSSSESAQRLALAAPLRRRKDLLVVEVKASTRDRASLFLWVSGEA